MTVQILLSTYNGASYLKPLMDSLLRQDYHNVKILVRDDGSSDSTVDLLREYAATYDNIKVLYGENIGFAKSFLKLLELSSPTADYCAFCDQDDVWQPDKISRAVKFLRERSPDTPVLYCSRLTVVNQTLEFISYSEALPKPLSFTNALVQGSIRGCTMVFNKAARQLFQEFPQAPSGHDWWVYLVVSAFGTVVYDKESRILYRQHQTNVYGISTSSTNKCREKIYRFLNYDNSHPIINQAQEFRLIYGNLLSQEHRTTLDWFLGSRKFLLMRLKYVLFCNVYRQTTCDNFILKIMLILNRV